MKQVATSFHSETNALKQTATKKLIPTKDPTCEAIVNWQLAHLLRPPPATFQHLGQPHNGRRRSSGGKYKSTKGIREAGAKGGGGRLWRMGAGTYKGEKSEIWPLGAHSQRIQRANVNSNWRTENRISIREVARFEMLWYICRTVTSQERCVIRKRNPAHYSILTYLLSLSTWDHTLLAIATVMTIPATLRHPRNRRDYKGHAHPMRKPSREQTIFSLVFNVILTPFNRLCSVVTASTVMVF